MNVLQATVEINKAKEALKEMNLLHAIEDKEVTAITIDLETATDIHFALKGYINILEHMEVKA